MALVDIVKAVATRKGATPAQVALARKHAVFAGQVSRALHGDLFEIEPEDPYPADYFETVEQAKQETDRGYEPPLKARVPDIVSYRAVFLDFSIWGLTAPPLVRSFLTEKAISSPASGEHVAVRAEKGERHARLKPESSLAELLKHPALVGHARLLLPWDDRAYDENITDRFIRMCQKSPSLPGFLLPAGPDFRSLPGETESSGCTLASTAR